MDESRDGDTFAPRGDAEDDENDDAGVSSSSSSSTEEAERGAPRQQNHVVAAGWEERTSASAAFDIRGNNDSARKKKRRRTRRLQQAADEVTSSNARKAPLLTLLPITTTNAKTQERALVDFRVYNEASAWLAWYHLTRQDSQDEDDDEEAAMAVVLPSVRERLKSCALDFELTMRDTRFSALHAARELMDALDPMSTTTEGREGEGEEERDTTDAPVLAFVGAARSAVSTALSFLSAAYEVPQVSSSSTAKNLDSPGTHPYFARTVPTNRGDARAVAAYLSRLKTASGSGGVSHVGILYVADDFGTNYHADLVTEAARRGIRVFSVSYEDSTIENAIRQLRDSGMRYIVGIFNPNTSRQLVRLARQYGIMGKKGYSWLLTEASLEFVNPSFELDRKTEADVAAALHGTGVLSLTVDRHDPFDAALLRFSRSREQQEMFIRQHREPDIFDNFTFPTPGMSLYQYLTYDALTALAIAACEAPAARNGTTGVATGRQLYEQLLKTEFEGVSGHVSFDNETGTRKAEGVSFQIQNLLLSENRSTSDALRFTSETAVLVNLRNDIDPVQYLRSFVFAGDENTPPDALPSAEMDLNLMSTAIRAFGLSLAGFVMLMSIGWMTWSFVYKNKDVVRASQPIFLCLLCIGTLVSASAVIPMSLQEPVSQRGLDIACMAQPWLASVGFVTVFSAVFSKTWRLNMVFKHGQSLRRVQVRPVDVMLPFLILMTVNIALLIALTVDAPLVWERKAVANYDEYGRSVESYGTCALSDETTGAILLSLIAGVNMSALVFALYQAYLARKLPTDFNESAYIAMAMASLFETIIIGVPLLFLASDDPTTSFLIRSILICISCLAILLPIFVPKWLQRNTRRRTQMDTAPRRRASVHVSIAGQCDASDPRASRLAMRRSWRSLFARGDTSASLSTEFEGVTGVSRVRHNTPW
jgi:ABC-type branched-subunit amino acid transport system substrate-binding protein